MPAKQTLISLLFTLCTFGGLLGLSGCGDETVARNVYPDAVEAKKQNQAMLTYYKTMKPAKKPRTPHH